MNIFSYKAILLDLSGVLYDGSRVIKGAAEAVEKIRNSGFVLRFVTNTASKSAHTITQDLQSMGIKIDEGELFTAPLAAKAYIEQQGMHPYCILPASLGTDFITQYDADVADCVLLGDAREGLSYQAMNEAFRLCQKGAPLIAIGMNKYFMADDGLQLDAGAFVRAIEWAADTKAVVMGKPSAEFFKQVVASTGFSAHQCLMVGDDVIADVKGAVDVGLAGCLVKTGKFQSGDETQLPEGAFILENINELI